MIKINEYVNGNFVYCHIATKNRKKAVEKLGYIYTATTFLIKEEDIEFNPNDSIKFFDENNDYIEIEIEEE